MHLRSVYISAGLLVQSADVPQSEIPGSVDREVKSLPGLS